MKFWKKIFGIFLFSLASMGINAQLSVVTSSTNVSCFGGSDGMGWVVSVTGGTPPYTYQWEYNDFSPIPGETNDTITGLPAGFYFVHVYDVDSTNEGIEIINILDGPNIAVLVNSTDVTCNGADDGTISIFAAGGNPPLEYSINNGSSYQSSSFFTNLPPGNYNVVVRDSKGCTKPYAFNPVVITEPGALVPALDSTIQIDCFGADNGAIYVTTSGGTPPYDFLWSGPGSFNETTEDIMGLEPGDYSLDVTDDNGCNTGLGPINIPEPPEIRITSVTPTDETCNNAGDGTISVSATGGTGTLYYTLTPGPTNTTGIFNGLSGNTYSISVTDDNGCGPVVQGGIVVNNPPVISASLNDTTAITCNGSNDGVIDVSGSGGTPPLIFRLNLPGPVEVASNGTGLFTGVTPGNGYFVTVTDVNNCPPATVGPWDFIDPAPIVIDDTTLADVSCNGFGDGAIDVDASGGTGTLTYSIIPAVLPDNNDGVFAGLDGGTYSVSITDSKGCGPATVNNLVITDPPPLVLNTVDSTHVTCNGDADGSITVSASGGTGTLQYSIAPAVLPPNSSGVFTPLDGGIYTVGITDINGCGPINTGNIIIIDPAAISIVTADTTSITCQGADDGTITVSAEGGTGTLEYTLNPDAVTNTSGLFTGIDPGLNYSVSVTDANACPAAVAGPWDFIEPDPILVSDTTLADVSCNGFGDGAIDVDASGGTGTLIYSINPPVLPDNNDGVFAGLDGGTYSVSVTDSRGCGPTVLSDLVIVDPAPIGISTVDSTHVTCNGDADASITVGATGGTGTLRYSIVPAVLPDNTTGIFAPLGGGSYTVSVTDDNGCGPVTTGDIGIIDPDPVSIFDEDTTAITCFDADDGTVTVVGQGGTGTLEYTLNPDALTNTSGLFTGIDPGPNYSVSVTDANGCPAATAGPWDFINPAPITITDTALTDITCAGFNDGEIIVTAGGGTGALTYTLTPGPIVNTTGIFSGLAPDTYTVSVTDQNNCTPDILTDLVLTEPSQVILVPLVKQNVSCTGANDGSITVTATGGSGDYTFSINPPVLPDNATGLFDPLAGGLYSISVTDNQGCPSPPSGNFNVAEPDPLNIDNEDTTGISCNGANDAEIRITASGGTGIRTYILMNPAPVDTNTTGIFTGLPPGTYTVEVDDENSCGPITSNPFTFSEPGPINVSVDGSSSKVLTCYGDLTGSLDITVTGGTSPYAYEWTGPGGFTDNSQNISGLAAGIYNLTVTDDNGCQQSYTPLDSITGPPEFLMTLSKTDRTCYDSMDDTVWVNASGGTPPYQYDEGFGPQASNIFTPGPGTHTIEVIDASACVISDTISVFTPSELKIDFRSAVDSLQSCNGDSNGIIILNASGGTGQILYSIDSGYNFVAPNTFTGLGGGTYYPFVRDENGCLADELPLFIKNPALLVIDQYAQDDILSCFNDSTGEVRIKAAGGTPIPGLNPYLYVRNPSDTSLNGRFTNLPAGPHDINIYDDNGCTIDTSITITAPPPILVSGRTTDITTCYDDTSGMIGMIATGGTGLTKGYVLQGDTTRSTDTVFYANLSVGTYNFTVFDSFYCTVPHTEVINAPDSISTDSLIVLPVSCYGDGDGEIRTYARGGTPPYTYILNPGADTSLTGIFTGLLPGSYTVSILDAQSCGPYTSPVLTVGEPPQFRFDSSRVSSISCGGFSDGSIEIFASGGVPPYEYSVDTGTSYDTASVITGLGPGTYIIVVRDSSSCTLTGDTIVLTEPPGISLDNVSVTDVTGCAGDSSGALLFEASGGTGPLEYSIDSLSWQPGGSFTGLPAGDYTGRVRDSLSCLVSFPQETILEPPAITAVITTTTALIPDSGSITMSASGGIPPFEYSIDSGAVFSSDTFYRVPSDLYRIVVRDANGCTYEETVFVSATPPLEVNVSSTGINCFGDTTGSITLAHVNGIGTVEYSIDGGFTAEPTGEFTKLTGGSYFIQVTDSHRIFRDTVIIFEPPPFDVTGTITPATCSRNSFDGSIGLSVSGATPPYTYLWSNGDTTKDLTGLEEMIYSLEILDSRGCRFTSEFEVTATVTLIADAGPDTVVCFGDQVMLNGSGGDEFTWSPEAGLDRIDVSNPVATVTDSVFYVLFTRELSKGCADRDTVFLSVYPDRGISAGQDTTVATGQTITLSATGGPFSAYQWLPVEGLDNPAAQSTQATITTEISYTVTGTTEFGCSESDSMNILIATGLTIYSGFTPNGDGTNDLWDIDDIIFYPNATVKVFDRWGRLVFSSVGYADDQRWDGKYQGKDLPTGTYYYIIDLKDGSEPYKGPVTIVR